MSPELFRLPWLESPVWSYGFMLATALVAGLWMTTRLAARDGLAESKVYRLGLFLIPSALAGAKLMALVVDRLQSSGGPQFSLALMQSSGAFLGGLLVALAASALLMRAWHLPWLKTADAFAPSIALGYAIARLGCFMAGCCWGKPTTSWIGVRFTNHAHGLVGTPVDVSLVPTQLIGSAESLLILAFLLRLGKRRAFDGQVILAYLALYSVARFAVEFLRDNPPSQVAGLSAWQLISVALFLFATGFYIKLQSAKAGPKRRKGQSTPFDPYRSHIVSTGGQ
jgi:phosphatidylglycerol---prolipoprotein diacylglyceryl transferase